MRFKKVYIEITNVCNLSCDFCPPHHRADRFMSVAAFSRVLDAVRPYTKYLYLHVKGEPLLHPDVEQMAALACGQGFHVNVTTNGTLLDRHPGLYRHLRQLNVSLHAADAPGEVLCILRNIQDTKICLRLWDGGRRGEAAALIEEIFHVKIGTERRMTLSEHVYLSQAEEFEWPSLHGDGRHGSGYCYGLIDQLGVLADGTIVPCCLDNEGDICLGNIFSDELGDVLVSDRARAIVDGFRRRTAVEPLCQTCSYKNRF